MSRCRAALLAVLLTACTATGGDASKAGYTLDPTADSGDATYGKVVVDTTTSDTGLVNAPTTPATLPAAAGDGDTLEVGDSPLALLALLEVRAELRDGYDRDLFSHWSDLDGNGCSTRHEVLIRDSITPVQLDPYRCFVVAGDWYSEYDATSHTDPATLDIDHLVPLAEAWDSGAWAWSPERREAFANDLGDRRSLQAVTDTVNQAKSDQDPADWLPPAGDYRCQYLADWVAVKFRWNLSVDMREHAALTSHLRGPCAGVQFVPVERATVPVDTSDGARYLIDDTYYPNCAAARAAGVAPLRSEDVGYRPALDRDGDGVACE